MNQHRQEINPTRSRPKRDVGSWLLDAAVALLCGVALSYLVYLFVSVVFLGESSACPQNFCP